MELSNGDRSHDIVPVELCSEPTTPLSPVPSYQEGETVSMRKRDVTSGSVLMNHNQLYVDSPNIHQVDDDHYTFKRGSTIVHVQTYAAANAGDVINNTEEESMISSAWTLTSILLAMIMIMITVVVKFSTSISLQLEPSIANAYVLTLFVIGFIWTTTFSIRSMFKNDSLAKFSKSNQTSNRYLKGVIVLFGLGIVLKCGLQFLSYLSVDLSLCDGNRVNAATIFFNVLFVLSQIKYLFRFSKVYIRNSSIESRLGIMLIISINFSVWIVSIVDETMLALGINEEHVDTIHHIHEEKPAGNSAHKRSIVPKNDSTLKPFVDEHENSCYCHSEFCNTVHVAEKFLFPFVIEFSLVASCLLYVTWSNISKQPPLCEGVVKPSYKLHNSYSGVGLGAFVLFSIIIALIYLTTTSSGLPHEEQTFTSEYQQLMVYSWTLVGIELCMLAACLFGLYLFTRIPRPLESSSMLDNVLLMICLLGPIGVDMFTMVAVIAGEENKLPGWSITLAHPLCNALQCILQLIVMMYGLQREPVTSADAQETAAHLRHGIHEHLRRTGPEENNLDVEDSEPPSKSYLRTSRKSITSTVSRLAHAKSNQMSGDHIGIGSDSNSLHMQNFGIPLEEMNESKKAPLLPKIVLSSVNEEYNAQDIDASVPIKETTLSGATLSWGANVALENPGTSEMPVETSQAILKIVSKTKIALPGVQRLRLRGVIMFLLVCNATLWMFMSLDGTAFTIHGYQADFYGKSAWMTILMICRPLSIFFRMHSAGCLFEIWSYA